MKLDKKNILIGAGVIIAGYLLWKKYKPKTCVKWNQPMCLVAPCPPTCVEYK
jgi:hypothetical protein